MIIAGLQKTTLVDYPGKVAATVFTRGCTFRCPFCHNPELVLPEKFLPEMDLEEFFDFLKSRRGRLEAVCITGGEPMMFADIGEFIVRMKDLGYLVKLDTNGSFPDRLEAVIKEGAVDYIATDIKAPLKRYREVSRSLIQNLEEKVTRSIDLIMNSGIDYEFRTTIAKPLHSMGDFDGMGEMITGARLYFIQNFVQSKHNDEAMKMQPFSGEELEQAKLIMQRYVKEVGIR
ncbi:MAG: anaerobic ribonucleoside-triphosphate reductase activating protein [Patescibacteria group bacterium]|jgi:pyruvate formate lyase activating enzyme